MKLWKRSHVVLNSLIMQCHTYRKYIGSPWVRNTLLAIKDKNVSPSGVSDRGVPLLLLYHTRHWCWVLYKAHSSALWPSSSPFYHPSNSTILNHMLTHLYTLLTLCNNDSNQPFTTVHSILTGLTSSLHLLVVNKPCKCSLVPRQLYKPCVHK